jgi:HTTM domain
MSNIENAVRRFLFEPQLSIWLTALRIGLGLQVLFYGFSLRGDWLEVLSQENQGLIRRDLTEAMLSAESPLIPRVGWIVDIGAYLGLNEKTALCWAWAVLMLAALLVVVGLFCRAASIVTWLLYVCTAKSAEVLSYGVDNFTIIGLFYLVVAPLPDAWSLDARWRGAGLRGTALHGLHRRVLQLHMCIIYFFGGIAKCAGRGWWNGTSLWRALTRAPFDMVPPEILIRAAFLLPLVGILVCVMEATYPIFIWPEKTRLTWFVGILGMHVGIALLMGMYLFAGIMIVLNIAAFGPGFAFNWRRIVGDSTRR